MKTMLSDFHKDDSEKYIKELENEIRRLEAINNALVQENESLKPLLSTQEKKHE